jgi:hypothetical protein
MATGNHAIGMANGSFTPPSSEPVHRHMDSENTKQHDNHVQRGDGHERDRSPTACARIPFTVA